MTTKTNTADDISPDFDASLALLAQRPAVQGWLLRIALAGQLLSIALAVLFCWRRASGNLAEVPPTGLLIAISLTIILTSNLLRAAWSYRWHGTYTPRRSLLFGLLLTDCVIALGIAITTIPAMPWLTRIAFWVILLSGELFWLVPWHWRSEPDNTVDIPSEHAPESQLNEDALAQCVNDLVETCDEPDLEFDEEDDSFDENLTQQLTRARTPEGADQLTGLVRVEFEPGEQASHADVAFCPTFIEKPDIEFYQIDGPTARIQQSRLMTCGVRFELKISEAIDEPCSVLIGFTATGGVH